MRVLDFKVDKQNISKLGDFSGLVAGTKGYLYAQFRFSTEWAGYRKVAKFTCRNGTFPVLLVDGKCAVPDEVAACQSFRVSVIGRRDADKDIDLTCGRVTVIQRRH